MSTFRSTMIIHMAQPAGSRRPALAKMPQLAAWCPLGAIRAGPRAEAGAQLAAMTVSLTADNRV